MASSLYFSFANQYSLGEGFLFLIVLVHRYKLSLCHTPIKPDLLGFLGIGVFACGLHDHVITRFTSIFRSVLSGPHLRLIVQELLKLMKPKFQQPLMNITSKYFSFKVWVILHFLNELNWTYRRLTGLVASFFFIPIVLVFWVGFHCITLLSDLFRLSRIRSQSWLWVAWSRGSHHLLCSVSLFCMDN